MATSLIMSGRFFIYAAVIIGSLVIALDFASVDLALPDLEKQFQLDLESVQWVINGYVLAFSVLMVAGGKLADAYGRKLVFVIGMSIFALSSLLGGMAWDGPSLIVFRVVQGVGAALLWPAMIGMACNAVGEENRGTALGLIFGSCSLGNAAGPVAGGALTQWFSWRWVLWINVPLALLTILITLWKVPKETGIGARPRNDWAGMGALTAGLVALMIVIYQVQEWGWTDVKTISLGTVAIVLLALFPFIEARAKEPIIPLDLMGNREFLTLCTCSMAICQLFFIVLLYFTQYAMKFQDEDPVGAGLRVVQFMLVYGMISYFAGPLYKRFGARKLLTFGLVSVTISSVILGLVGPGAGWLAYNGALVLLGVGVGTVIPNISSRAIETVGVARASLVSGITFMCQLSGAALMLAISTAIFAGVSTHILDGKLALYKLGFTQSDRQELLQIINGSRTIHPPESTAGNADELFALAESAFQGGLQAVMWFSTVLVLGTLVLVILYVPPQAAVPKDTKIPAS